MEKLRAAAPRGRHQEMAAEDAGPVPVSKGLTMPFGLAPVSQECTWGLGSEGDTDHWRWTRSPHRGAAGDMATLIRTRGGGTGLGQGQERLPQKRNKLTLWTFGGGPKGGISQKQILVQHKEEAHQRGAS